MGSRGLTPTSHLGRPAVFERPGEASELESPLRIDQVHCPKCGRWLTEVDSGARLTAAICKSKGCRAKRTMVRAPSGEWVMVVDSKAPPGVA